MKNRSLTKVRHKRSIPCLRADAPFLDDELTLVQLQKKEKKNFSRPIQPQIGQGSRDVGAPNDSVSMMATVDDKISIENVDRLLEQITQLEVKSAVLSRKICTKNNQLNDIGATKKRMMSKIDQLKKTVSVLNVYSQELS